PLFALFTSRIAFVVLTAGAQAERVPSSVAKRNRAGPLWPPEVTWNAPLPSKMAPVTAAVEPAGLPGGGGVGARGDRSCPVLLYRVEKPVPLSATQKGPEGLAARPQGLTRWASVCAAIPGTSDTRLVWKKLLTEGRERSSSRSTAGRADCRPEKA